MNTTFLFKVDLEDKFSNILVVYVAGFDFKKNHFIDQIQEAFNRSPFSKHIVIISAKYNEGAILSELLENDESIKQLKERINNYQELSLHGCFYSENGERGFIEKRDSLDFSGFKLKKNIDRIIEFGIYKIIEKRQLVMEASDNYHYIKPSGKHCSRFIKASNVMESGAEVSFLAINLLRFTTGDIDKIYVDTAGILPIAYKLVSIKNRFNENSTECFIDSFGGYDGADNYPFSGSKKSLVIISATTSNGLNSKLREIQGVSQADFISLFVSSSNNISGKKLVDFNDYRNIFGGSRFNNIHSYSEHECELCIFERSVPLSLSNSQFIFSAPETKQYLPLSHDSSSELRELISKYKDTGVFKCLHDGLGGTSDRVPEYFIDVSELVLNKEYQDVVKNKIKREYPLYADLMIHCNDVGAKDLAQFIGSQVEGMGPSFRLLNMKELQAIEKPKEYIKDIQGVVVVAGSCESGKSLLNISRLLRNFGDVPITYIVGFAKVNDQAGFIKLKKDLTFCNSDFGFHKFIAINEIILPINEHRVNSWQREEQILNDLKINSDKVLEDIIDKREKHLKFATSPKYKGIGDEIFLKSHKGSKMTLGPTFAFWNDKDNKDKFNHQATVYYTISSIIQRLRYVPKKNGDIPLGTGYIIKQLDPLLFDRFNEGIIHASILRCAKPRELDYSADDASSKIVGSLIERMVNKPDEDDAQALPEFLMAICSDKLKIKKDHLLKFKDFDYCKISEPFTLALFELAKSHLFKSDSESGSVDSHVDNTRF
jgi:hypothetical protein